MNTIPFAVTLGDAAGIGPEIIAKAASRLLSFHPYIVFGCLGVMRRAVRLVGADVAIRVVDDLNCDFPSDVINVYETCSFSSLPQYGKVQAGCGSAAFNAVVEAVQYAQAGKVAAVVTAPINKAALAAAGIGYPGHTEILQHYGKVDHCAMMLVSDKLRVVLVTVHCSLQDAILRIDQAAEEMAIKSAYQAGRALGLVSPKIAVAGLNPHAGEDGLFGSEEQNSIIPAIKNMQSIGVNVQGPIPGDTVFMRARQGEFDVVVAQYHDQGLIPIKYMGLEQGVNITLGLPFVRTSPDHGTAFDIAGTGKASIASFEKAFLYALQLVQAKHNGEE